MIVIKTYSDTVKKSFGSSVSQGRFMREVFKASGYDRFPSEKWLFQFTVTVTNKSRESTEA